jgi:hypothetical protein
VAVAAGAAAEKIFMRETEMERLRFDKDVAISAADAKL